MVHERLPGLAEAAAVGARKKAPTIAPPNQTIAEPTWTTLKKISHQSIRRALPAV